MQLRILGCSGGIAAGRRTTSFLVDGDVLIDAGSGVGDLTLSEMERIKHIVLTHSHLDHVHAIPLLLDSMFDRAEEPITVHALPETISALREHMFNWVVWPDFTSLPHPDSPVLRYVPMQPGEEKVLDGRRFRMVPVNHVVPSVGYVVTAPDGGTFAFSGDTTSNDTLWNALNGLERLDLLVVECAFSNARYELCRKARHYCPNMLAEDLIKLNHRPAVYLSHAKPGEERQIMEECRAVISDRKLDQLSGGEIFTL